MITNCIIYYNANILSHLLAYKEKNDDIHGANMLKRISPVAWQHINLLGRYEFSKKPKDINMNEIVQELDQIQITSELAPSAWFP